MPNRLTRGKALVGGVDVPASGLSIGGVAVTATAAELNRNAAASTAAPILSQEVTFTETSGAGVWTGAIALPAGSTILDIIVNGVALWTSQTSATLKVGDGTDDDGYYTGVDLKATDLLAGESLSFALAGGKAGAYIANSQVSPRYNAAAVTIAGIITKVGTTGTAGRTRMTVYYSLPTSVAATKV